LGRSHQQVNERLHLPFRFRYHPRAEAGHDPHPQARAEGVQKVRTASSCPFCFICSDWRN